MGAVQPKVQTLYTAVEYLELERAAEERHEYLDGQIYEMAGESLEHGDICTNIVGELRAQLRGRPCRALSKDTKVRSGALPSPRRVMKGLFSYPDVLVVCGAPQFHDEYRDILLNPNVIIEVLSEATEGFDRGEKFRRYRTHLPSLTDYLLVAQDMPFIDHFRIGDDSGVWKFSSVEGMDGTLHVASIDCRLPLVEVYDRVIFPLEAPEPDGLIDES